MVSKRVNIFTFFAYFKCVGNEIVDILYLVYLWWLRPWRRLAPKPHPHKTWVRFHSDSQFYLHTNFDPHDEPGSIVLLLWKGNTTVS